MHMKLRGNFTKQQLHAILLTIHYTWEAMWEVL
jgi:hypothetical protein